MAAIDTAISAGWAFSVRREFVLGTLEYDRGEWLAERIVDLVEHGPGLGIGVRQLLAHANGLASLTGKCECPHIDGLDIVIAHPRGG